MKRIFTLALIGLLLSWQLVQPVVWAAGADEAIESTAESAVNGSPLGRGVLRCGYRSQDHVASHCHAIREW